jgi:hypothetical protein
MSSYKPERKPNPKPTSKTKRALIFTDLPLGMDKVAFRYELENYGEICKLEFLQREAWDGTAKVSFLREIDAERLFTKIPTLKFCGIPLKAKWGYFT